MNEPHSLAMDPLQASNQEEALGLKEQHEQTQIQPQSEVIELLITETPSQQDGSNGLGEDSMLAELLQEYSEIPVEGRMGVSDFIRRKVRTLDEEVDYWTGEHLDVAIELLALERQLQTSMDPSTPANLQIMERFLLKEQTERVLRKKSYDVTVDVYRLTLEILENDGSCIKLKKSTRLFCESISQQLWNITQAAWEEVFGSDCWTFKPRRR